MKDEEIYPASGGVMVAVAFISFIVIALFIWSPVSHYLGKWNNYWEEPEYCRQYPISEFDKIPE